MTAGKNYELEFSIIGYETKTITEVDAAAGQLNELNVTLQVKAKTGDAVIITAKTSSARKETINSVITFQKNTNTVASVISAESIRRSPDKNTGEVIKTHTRRQFTGRKVYYRKRVWLTGIIRPCSMGFFYQY